MTETETSEALYNIPNPFINNTSQTPIPASGWTWTVLPHLSNSSPTHTKLYINNKHHITLLWASAANPDLVARCSDIFLTAKGTKYKKTVRSERKSNWNVKQSPTGTKSTAHCRPLGGAPQIKAANLCPYQAKPEFLDVTSSDSRFNQGLLWLLHPAVPYRVQSARNVCR